MSNLLLAGLSGSMPWPVRKYTMFWGRSLSPSVAVTCSSSAANKCRYLLFMVGRGQKKSNKNNINEQKIAFKQYKNNSNMPCKH